MRRIPVLIAFMGILTILSACVTSGGDSKSSRNVIVGWVAAEESLRLNSALAGIEPVNYVVWLWNNRANYDKEIKAAENTVVDLVIYEGDRGRELWRKRVTASIHRTWIPEELALRGGLICAEVEGRRITHGAKIGHKKVGGKDVYTSCSYQLPAQLRSGQVRVNEPAGGFGIPLILEKGGR